MERSTAGNILNPFVQAYDLTYLEVHDISTHENMLVNNIDSGMSTQEAEELTALIISFLQASQLSVIRVEQFTNFLLFFVLSSYYRNNCTENCMQTILSYLQLVCYIVLILVHKT